MYTAHFFNKMSEINYWNWILYFRICYRLHPKRSVLWEVDINFDCMACAMFNSMKNACTYGYLDVGCLWPLSHLLCLSYSLGMGPNPSVNSTYSLTLRHRLSGRTDGITPSPRNLTRVRKLIKLSFIERFYIIFYLLVIKDCTLIKTCFPNDYAEFLQVGLYIAQWINSRWFLLHNGQFIPFL